MKEKRNLHLKVQELCDCYATTDPLQEMSRLPEGTDKEEEALKWLALTALHGINHNASKITIRRAPGRAVTVTAEENTTLWVLQRSDWTAPTPLPKKKRKPLNKAQSPLKPLPT